MTTDEIFNLIKEKKSFLCVGLDTDISKIPEHLKNESDPIFTFNKAIIDATIPYAIAYKPNLAFYESEGSKGWESLQKTMEYIPKNVFTIADAKRGDIGNTSEKYAEAFFKKMGFDAITISPYMGRDAIEPYLKYSGKYSIILAITSNQGAMDFQFLPTAIDNKKLYEKVLIRSSRWGTEENMMFVVGATRPELIKEIREIIPNHFLLVPGVGVQGGSLEEITKYGMNPKCGLIVNASRSIIYASSSKNFAADAGSEAHRMQQQMNNMLKLHHLIE
ncbi:MAG: orotidine-5'-phosphate decarboxylase [Bacteroidetes bacterium]|nr:orotidine-5'-phosphate decarboxylase [Bacteroidota bacterium]MBV6461901.1 Orotidine 5'-phosphate decarboxylase [Flavobacteriales bacterium]WKZ74472.1 MAG: orotidine-5'-phosphate decarboxylase [Vicingaceae bacterium]MCL4816199.1 orotidine-5'-phosphate decarboxylase [Flavobacteriales bacterium]NOG95085.1 orotidine-5'-phosphate decarboxylase [Bacteroidota bacterium]